MHKLKNNNSDQRVWNAITLLCFAFFIFFFLYPIFRMFIGSLFSNGEFSLEPFKKFFSTKFYMSAVWNSLKVGICVTLITAVTGTTLALIARTTHIYGKKIMDILLLVSIITPPFLGAYSWIVLFGRTGFLTELFSAIFNTSVGSIYGFKGIVFVFVVHSTPLMYMYISGALKNVDNSLNEASESLGCVGIKRIFKVVLPLILPTMLSSGLLVFMSSIADYGTPKLIGEGYRTMATMIYQSFLGEMARDTSFAAAMSVIMVLFTAGIFLLQRWISTRKTIEMSSMNPIEPKKRKGIVNILAHFYCYFVTLVTILPIVTIAYNSFQNCTGQLFTKGFSLDSYKKVFSGMGSSMVNTYLYGLAAIAIILVIGILVSYANVRRTSRLTKLMDTTTMFPFIVPGSVLGIALILAFNSKPLVLNGTALIIIGAWAVRRLPYTIRSSTAVLHQISPSVEEASRSLGANGINTFTKVTLPMMFTGVLPGALLSWVTVITELSCTILLYTTNTKTMAIAIYTEVLRGQFGTASALSTILLMSAVIVLAILFKLSKGKWEFSL